MLQVTAQGKGIADSVKDRLFEPFVSTKPGGSGLGLSIVHRAVEAHHGFIVVSSAGAAGGTKFTVLLPRLGAEGSKKAPSPVRASEA